VNDPSLELQAALSATLRSAMICDGRVYDAVKPDTLFPYVTLGDCQVLPDKDDCIDGSEVSLTIDVWSRSVGYPQVKAITKQLVATLDDQPITVVDFDVIVFEVESINYLRDPDGLTRHASISFHCLLVPA